MSVADDFPAPYNSEKDNPSPISPLEALAAIKLPPGFRATLFAAEPDVQNPIAMSWDARGRLWVAENYTYAERTQRFDLRLRDRIVIFDEGAGRGSPDPAPMGDLRSRRAAGSGDPRRAKRKVFTDNVQMLTSVAIGHGGVYVIDWSDTGECHENTGVHRTSGRIFKITHGDPEAPPHDLTKESTLNRPSLLLRGNEWFGRQVRLWLHEEALSGNTNPTTKDFLNQCLDSQHTTVTRLKAAWSLKLINELDDAKLLALLKDDDEHLRVWAIRCVDGGVHPPGQDRQRRLRACAAGVGLDTAANAR